MSTFSSEIITAVLAHMNDDHAENNVTILRAFVDNTATTATMTGLDNLQSFWSYTNADGESKQAAIAWSKQISERAEIRREVVILYRNACEKLGIAPSHE